MQAPAAADTPTEKRAQIAEAKRRRHARAKARAARMPKVEEDEDDPHYSPIDPEDLYDELAERIMATNS